MHLENIKTEIALGSELSIIRLVESIICHAEDSNASDIHIDPTEYEVMVRLRIDGELHITHLFPKSIHEEIICRIKVLAGIRTDEHHSPHDGRFRFVHNEKQPLDMRVSILPTFYGENAVIRLLRKTNQHTSLENLGLQKKDIATIKNILEKSTGMILVTGPTGSGKTTTLYTLLSLINTPHTSIITLEDPVEYALNGIRQIQVHAGRGLTFAHGLRSIVRQDPDVIMVGEIRDIETASIAIHTALTGHLLLSSLHTKSAASALPRLIDMNIDPYLIASTVELIIGQRLVRKICTQCKKNGCSQCSNTGYQGRIALYEILCMNTALRSAVMNKVHATKLDEIAREGGMKTLSEYGHELVCAGITSQEEVINALS